MIDLKQLEDLAKKVPDLLTALQDAMIMIDAEYYFDHPTAVQARAAIARATGE